MSIESVMPSNHLILCHPLLPPPSIFPSIRVFSNESVLRIRWPKYWSLSFSISPSNEYSGLISFMMDWLDLLPVQGTLKSLPQHHSSKESVLSFLYSPTLTPIHDYWKNHQFSSVQLLSRVWLFATPWTAARQVSLSITNSQSLFKLMSIESVMPSKHLIICRSLSSCPQSFPASVSFLMSRVFALGGQSIGAPASASVLPMNIQGWFPLGLTGLISLLSKGLSKVFSRTVILKHQFFKMLKARS